MVAHHALGKRVQAGLDRLSQRHLINPSQPAERTDLPCAALLA